MKKILLVVTRSENGGAQKWIKEQTEILSGTYEIYIASDENGWLLQNTKVKKTMNNMKIRNKFSFSYLFSLCRFVKDNQIDLIVASSANAGVYSRLCKLFCKVKVIYVGHGWSAIYNGGRFQSLFVYIECLLAKITDSVLCVSDSDYQKAKEIIGVRPGKLKLIKNKIIPMQKREGYDKSVISRKVLCVARFRAPKRNELLIEATKDLDLDLYFVGDGPLRQGIQKSSNNRTYFFGEVDGFNEFYKYDVFALISDSEGLPLSAIEAMSAGLPLVLSDVGGCSELISENGVLVENTAESIKLGIKRTLEKQELYSQNSSILFSKEFDLIQNKHIYINYFESVISNQ